MAPEISKPENFDFLAESFDPETKTFLPTSFYKVESDDSIYYGQIFKQKAGLVKYHGCRVQRGYITGLALGCQSGDLEQYIERDEGPIEVTVEKFMASET